MQATFPQAVEIAEAVITKTQKSAGNLFHISLEVDNGLLTAFFDVGGRESHKIIIDLKDRPEALADGTRLPDAWKKTALPFLSAMKKFILAEAQITVGE